ncbi:MAG: hypothetical protein K0R20_2624, partial [Actinomycetia bacterium]|nr:hypothetical protein [Actinomycetes bacterium]
ATLRLIGPLIRKYEASQTTTHRSGREVSLDRMGILGPSRFAACLSGVAGMELASG